jgi:hypothetical protein
MNDEKPEIGLVIRHLCLWRNEAMAGKDEGRKARPCVIVHKQENQYGQSIVYIAPITHTKPYDLQFSQEIPLATKQRLKLDDEPSWVITNEVNIFTWKGFDLRPTPSGSLGFGHLPYNLTETIVQQIKQNARNQRLAVTNRD